MQQSIEGPEHAASDQTPITELLMDWRAGDRTALEKLAPLIYNDLRKLAAGRLRSEAHCRTLQPTALVHEAYIQLAASRQPDWENRSHFFGIATRIMRQILIQRARARQAEKRGGGRDNLPLDDIGPISDEQSHGILELTGALAELSDEDPRKARIVELRYVWGLTTGEIAIELGVSTSTVEREMRIALPWVRRRIECRSA